MLIKRLLIANRGEIACRIIETCQRIGIESVAVYAIADKNQKHVLMADQAICIGEGPPETSYHNVSNIIQAAISLECDAIHPGYGFLSENAQFVKQVQAAGLLFVGPALSVIQTCENKLWVKQLVQSINIPTVPGVDHTITSHVEIKNIVSEFGYPCILKANYGAGGRHIYILNNHDELNDLIISLKTKTMQQQPIEFYLERYLTPIKHLEVQLIADQFKHVLVADIRDCSLQTNHRKIIEESAHALEPRLRENLKADALKIAELLNIDNVCTIEFIVDANHNHYFIEINPRLQVEHAISEVIYKIDLVQIQLESIQKQPLKFKQSDFNTTSHALEARLSITDKSNAKIDFFYIENKKHLRVDSMITNHGVVPLIYDGLIAKIIVWGHNRDAAIQRLVDTLFKAIIIGPKTNLELLKTIVSHPDFLNGTYTTQSVQNMIVSKAIPKNKDDFYCEQCHQITTYQDFENYSYVCPYCDYHPRISAKAYLDLLLSKDHLIEVDTHLKTQHHHHDYQYKQKLQQTKVNSKSEEALACAIGYLGPHQVCLAIFEPFFMMGSLGSVAGEKITRLSEYAQAQKLPLIIISASGGARMQEGVEALMQMAKTTLAIQRFLKDGLFISVCANPTMGGTTASFMMQGDVIIAHPQAHIGFSGKRVVKQTLGQPFDTNVQKSETLHSQGWLDLLVSRKALKAKLIELLNLHMKNEILFKPKVLASNQPLLDASPWNSVQKARDSRRFKASDIIAACFENCISFSTNNRCLPSSLISCIGLFNDLPVTILAHQKNVLNGQSGMLVPSDYRRVVRAIKQAEKFKRPIITLIDTPGADPSMASELKGQASAISESLAAFANTNTCVITIILSEGGSGGALAMGIGDALFMLEHAYYSIISPEGYASILLRDASKAKQVAQSMKITAKELKAMQIVDEIILEPSFEAIISQIKDYLNNYLVKLMAYDAQTLIDKRYEKYRNIARSDAKHLVDQGGFDVA